MMKWTRLLLVFVILFASGCSQQSSSAPQSLSDLYPGDIRNVDRVEIVDGSSGEKKSFAQYDAISKWIERIEHVVFTPDPDQEKRDGFSFSVKLLEGGKQKLSFTTNSINDRYYITDESFYEAIKEFFAKSP